MLSILLAACADPEPGCQVSAQGDVTDGVAFGNPFGVAAFDPSSAVPVESDGLRLRGATDFSLDGPARLSFAGWEPVPVRFDLAKSAAGVLACSPSRVELRRPVSTVTGTVRPSAATEGPYEVAGCGGRTRTAKDGSYSLPVVPSQSCQLWVRLGERPWRPVGAADIATLASGDLPVDLPYGVGSLGVLVAEGAEPPTVVSGPPGVADGLAAGDVVLSLGGVPTPTYGALVAEARALPPGTRVDLEIEREGARQTVSTLVFELVDPPLR